MMRFAMSRLLVAIQFGLILLLLLPLPIAIPSSPAALILLAIGILLGIWALSYNRIGNFNVRPEPKIGARLVTSGPYRFIRHPMYTSVLFTMAPWAFFSDDPSKMVYWLLLLTVLWIKSSFEEKMLTQQYSEYADYIQTTGRFLPQLFNLRGKP